MKLKTIIPALLLSLLAAGPAAGQTSGRGQAHFYNLDQETAFEGTVREVVLEPRYKGAAPFLVLRVEETARGMVDVEVSPAWFFNEDIHSGEKVKGTGSVSEAREGRTTIIARELKLRGRTLTLRDKQGFPNWRGGPGRKHEGKRFGTS